MRTLSPVILGNRVVEKFYRTPISFETIDYLGSLKEFANYSNMIWSYFGYQGLLNPWHSDSLGEYLVITRKSRNRTVYPVKEFIKKFKKLGISERAYSILLFSISEYSRFERPLLLLSQPDKFTWFKKLVDHAGVGKVEECANLILRFIEKQVEDHKRANINIRAVVDEDLNGGKFFKAYHILCDRISQFEYKNIDINFWMDFKYKKILEAFPNQFVHFKTLVNMNVFEPTDEDIIKVQDDPWLGLKIFLGLNSDCQFVDGMIPKGWRPNSDDFVGTKDIVSIDKDGFYYRSDGSRRKGKYHYMSNIYLTIRCDTSNFRFFKDSWDKKSLYGSRPTWDEYNQWALYPDKWDENGEAVNGRIKPVKWRIR